MSRKLMPIIFCTAAAVFCISCAELKRNDTGIVDIETPVITVSPSAENTPYATPHITPQQTVITDEPISTDDIHGSEEPNGTDDIHGNEGVIALESNGLPVRNTMPTELYGLSAEECEAWFSDAVFVGDSVMKGWQSYNYAALAENPAFFGETRFFCEGSYGAGHALEPVSDDSVHPIYGGEQRTIEDALSMIGAKKAFICLGLNDITIFGVDKTADNFRELVSRIHSKNPDIEIYIISTMYMYKGSERDKLNNANILALNKKLAALCTELNMEFVNIASHLIDEEGFVPDEYSSDKYVHQTYEAYDVWADVLRSVAARHIKGITTPVFE